MVCLAAAANKSKTTYYAFWKNEIIIRACRPKRYQKAEKRTGANIHTPPKRDPLWKLFIEKFEDPIIRILLIAAFLSLGISFIHNEFIETIGIFCAIFLATGVSFWFEMDARKKFDLLNLVNDETIP